MVESVLTGALSGLLASYSKEAIDNFFDAAFSARPSLRERLRAASSTSDLETIFYEVVGVVDASAGEGEIKVDGGIIEAILGIRFDHSSGTVTIAGSTLSSTVLLTGGRPGSTGVTTIGEGTQLISEGTSIDVGAGCQILISGDAQIKQT